jgi:hypothetical protein
VNGVVSSGVLSSGVLSCGVLSVYRAVLIVISYSNQAHVSIQCDLLSHKLVTRNEHR